MRLFPVNSLAPASTTRMRLKTRNVTVSENTRRQASAPNAIYDPTRTPSTANHLKLSPTFLSTLVVVSSAIFAGERHSNAVPPFSPIHAWRIDGHFYQHRYEYPDSVTDFMVTCELYNRIVRSQGTAPHSADHRFN